MAARVALPGTVAAQHAGHGRPAPDSLAAPNNEPTGPTAHRVGYAVGAHAVALATPTAGRQSLTEGYLSQLATMGTVSAAGGRIEAMAMLNFEGLTLERGERTTGGYGEGYVDRS